MTGKRISDYFVSDGVERNGSGAKLFLLAKPKRTAPGYGMVVRAETEWDARVMAREHEREVVRLAMSEVMHLAINRLKAADDWLDKEKTLCREVKADGGMGVLMPVPKNKGVVDLQNYRYGEDSMGRPYYET